MTSSDEIQQLAGLLWLQSNIKGWVAICLQHVLVFKYESLVKAPVFTSSSPHSSNYILNSLFFFCRIATLLITTGKVSSPGISRDFLFF